jgi:hypothetical protein
MVEGFGLDFLYKQEVFDFSITSTLVLGSTQPGIRWVPVAVSPGREVDFSLCVVPRLRIIELYFTPPYVFMALCLIN